MAKPRVFVSSTYYDLKHIRNSLEAFIESLGYDAVMFESGDIPFHHDQPLDQSCYAEVKGAHILVLIIGGRYGAMASEAAGGAMAPELDEKLRFYNSITKKEYETARDADIPIYTFVEKNVLAEYQTYKENKGGPPIRYAHVDNANIFKLIDEIFTLKRNNLIKDFEKFDDISFWLRDQWAGLFAEFLARKTREATLRDLNSQISDLRAVSSVLREYTESIMRELQPQKFEGLITEKQKRLRDSRLERFIENPLIGHFLSKSPKGIGPARMYDAFVANPKIDGFMDSVGFDDDFKKSFLKNYREPAEGDYEELRDLLL